MNGNQANLCRSTARDIIRKMDEARSNDSGNRQSREDVLTQELVQFTQAILDSVGVVVTD